MEFLSLLCHLLIIGLSAAVPLYTGGTYWKLGDTKYMLFRNLAVFCLGIWLAVGICEALRRLIFRRRPVDDSLFESRQQEASDSAAGVAAGRRKSRKCPGLSAMDVWMLCYGAAVVLSALFSQYKETAWHGYSEWYMGALSQLLFTGIYFLFPGTTMGSSILSCWGSCSFCGVWTGNLSSAGRRPCRAAGRF